MSQIFLIGVAGCTWMNVFRFPSKEKLALLGAKAKEPFMCNQPRKNYLRSFSRREGSLLACRKLQKHNRKKQRTAIICISRLQFNAFERFEI